jgi:glycosyltransferase involved in cell wall biosynthesis
MAERSLSFCMVTTFYPPYHFGGDAVYVYRLANELARRGHRVTVVHSADAYRLLTGEEPGGVYPNEPGVTVRTLRTRRPYISPLAPYLTGRPGPYRRQLAEALGERFDVIHYHNISLVGGPGVLSLGEGTKLYSTHEHWLVCPMHVLWRQNREPCNEPRCLRCTLAFHRPPQLWRYTGLLSRQLEEVDMFLAPSQFTIDAHASRGFERPIRHLPYFLPTSAARTEIAPPPGSYDRPYFLYVGRLERLKGVAGLIEHFRQYREADLLIAGDGSEAKRLRRQAAGLEHVRFLGHVHPSALPALYERAIALVVPSIGYEAFGIVIVEAFAQRTPVIVRDLGALPEPVRESGGGFVFRTGDELATALEALRLDPELRRELGERAHAGWLETWSEGPHIESYLEAIAEAGERARRR